MSQIKCKYREIRKQFKHELYQKCLANKSLAMLIVTTYTAWHHFRHITLIWSMFRKPLYRPFQEAYNDQLMGKHLCGGIDIFHSLYFADRKLYDDYYRKIPQQMAMGDALGVAYRTLKDGD